MKKVIKVTSATFLILLFVVLSMGGGHAYYLPAKLIYPYSMIIWIVNNQISLIAIIIAIIQIPIYITLISRKPIWKIIILIIHILSVIICLNLTTETYTP